jgi:site-specific recombinase XerD
MNRRRTKDKDLPQRVYVKSGAYFFVPAQPMLNPATKKVQAWIRLCRVDDGKSKMLVELAKLIDEKKLAVGGMPFLCDDFKKTKLGKYEKETREQYTQYLGVIAEEFEEFHAAEVTTKEFADFLYDKFSTMPNTAQKYAGLARKLFKHAISRHGFRKDNPIDQLDMADFETSRREMLPTHEHVRLIRAAGMTSKKRKDTGKTLPTPSGPMFACIIDMTYLLWARAIDIRMLHEDQIQDGRIRIKASKTRNTSGKIVDLTITAEIQAVLDRARAIKAGYQLEEDLGYLFPSMKGTPYTKSGLTTMWDRARDRSGITDSVWFKDLRALGATDALKAGEKRGEISTRLSHMSEKTTEIYLKEAVAEASHIDLALPWKDAKAV